MTDSYEGAFEGVMFGAEPRPAPAPARPTFSSEFDQVRATVDALHGAAALLQGALEQRQELWAEMRGAEMALTSLRQQRIEAEQALAAAQVQLARTTYDLESVRSQHTGVLTEFDTLVQGALVRRGALVSEISELERRRAELLAQSVLQAQAPRPSESLTSPAWPTSGESPASATSAAAASSATSPALPASAMFAASPASAPSLVPSDQPGIVPSVSSESGDAGQSAAPVAEVHGARPSAPAKRKLPLPAPRHVFTALLGALLLGLAVLLTPISQVFGGVQLLAVMSGSMEPTIPVGGIVGVVPVPASDLQVGDIITFANQSNPDVLITHRVASLESRGGQTLLTTKGDANDAADALATSATRAVGRVEFFMPWLGYAMIWLATPLAKIGILVISVLGFALPSFKRPSRSKKQPPTAYQALEREIQDLLPTAT